MDNCFLIVNKIAKNKAKDHISLSYDERFLRRKKLISDNGFEFLVNLPEGLLVSFILNIVVVLQKINSSVFVHRNPLFIIGMVFLLLSIQIFSQVIKLNKDY